MNSQTALNELSESLENFLKTADNDLQSNKPEHYVTSTNKNIALYLILNCPPLATALENGKTECINKELTNFLNSKNQRCTHP